MKKTTMKDIAEVVGVSKTTVSMVLNKKNINVSEETRNKIFRTAKEMHYIPNFAAKSLSTNKSETIGIIVPDIENPFFSEMARAIEDNANKYNYNVILCNSDNDIKKEKKYVELLISKQVDGVIFISGGESTKSIEKLDANQIPYVLVDRHIKYSKIKCGVYCSNKAGIAEGLNYLFKKNRKKIAFVSGPQNLENAISRLDTYKKIMKDNNILNEKYIFESEFSIEGGKKATEKILSSSLEIEGIFYSNDAMAAGGIKTLIRQGYKIPEDISVVGYDNIKIAEILEPELTTVAQPIYKMGQYSCELLIKIIQGEEVPEEVILESYLVIRGSA